MKKSKPITLDRRDINSLLDVIGRYGAVVAAGIIAMLSVCAAFFIYRSVRGQRGKCEENNGKETASTTEERSSREDQPTESTGEHQEGKQKCSNESRGNIDLSATNSILFPTEEDLNETALKDLEEITDELLTELEPKLGDKTDSDLHQCMEMDSDDNTECEDHFQHKDDDDGCEEDAYKLLADVSLRSIQCEASDSVEYLRDLGDSETGLSGDADEPSETESAQEIIDQRHQDVPTCKPKEDLLDQAFTNQNNSPSDQAGDASKHSKSRFEADNKTVSTVGENSIKKHEDHHDCHFPQTNDFDCCCYDKKTNMEDKIKNQSWFHSGSYPVDAMGNHQQHHRNGLDYHNEPLHQNFLGYHTGTFIDGSSAQVGISSESSEKKADEKGASMAKKHKNEISIMDAIMDNNEWQNVGGPELRDLPWITPAATCSSSSIDEKLAEKENELETTVTLGQADTSLVKEEGLVNRRVATVPHLPQPFNVTFRIHFITYSPSQLVAVTGNLQELGAWESFVPLHRAKDGFWANTITLPMESQLEWKFVLVEDGKICRWEECGNRHLVLTSQINEVYLDKCWGCT
ncbi:otolith matrix protein OMM-64-like [Myxocyprinus asiaticus]|uniref:otolith matrix protein OMM-64-like n=1 Tax=Myxocyprinus asiaticus TaxID=70543 RepID=UPI002223609C|nr:otolith matrix protein OMM-64-like [Myxocyprinus asiaticus]